VVAHGLDDVVQWVMFPVGDPATRGVQCHTKWCGSEHTRHLRIGKTAFCHRQVALVRLGSVWQIVLRTVAQDGLAAHGAVLAVEKYFVERSARVRGAGRVRRLSQSGGAFLEGTAEMKRDRSASAASAASEMSASPSERKRSMARIRAIDSVKEDADRRGHGGFRFRRRRRRPQSEDDPQMEVVAQHANEVVRR
jgi:hypothetical protein